MFFPHAEFSPEFRLLCACSRVKPRDTDLHLQATLAPRVNGGKLISLAIRHRVEPLLYHNLKHHAGLFPDDILDALSVRVRKNTEKSLHALLVNVKLARTLHDHDIRYLPLKGATLAQRYYGSIGLRHSNDIDFWVPARSVAAVRTILTEQGCTPCDNHHFQDIEARGERHRRFLLRCFHHDVWVHPRGEHLEMHWRLTSNVKGFVFDPVDLLASGEAIEVAGKSMTMVGPVPLLLYLCAHGAGHAWFRLKWLMDLPQILESREWNWPQVIAEARRANCLSALLLGLKLAQELFGCDIPGSVATEMKKQYFLNWQAKKAYQELNRSEYAVSNQTFHQSVRRLLYRTTLMESFGFVGEEMNHRFLSAHDLRVVQLPDCWFSAYYCLRPVLWLWRQISKRRRVRLAKQ